LNMLSPRHLLAACMGDFHTRKFFLAHLKSQAVCRKTSGR